MGLPPSEANAKDRKIAWFIYVLLVLGWLAYTIYFIVEQVGERDNPPIDIAIKRVKYLQPKFSLCTFNPTITFTDTVCQVYLGKTIKNCTATQQTLPFTAADPAKLDSTVIEGLDPDTPGDFTDPPPDDGSFFDNETQSTGYALQGTDNFKLQATTNSSKIDIYCMTFNMDKKTVLRPRTDSLRFKVRFDFGFEIPDDVLALSLFVYDNKLEDSDDFIVPFSKKSIVSVKKTTQESFRSDTVSFYDANIVSVDLGSNYDALSGAYAAELQIKISDFEVKFVTEVDPVSPALILGTVSGFWNLVGIAFAIFFIPNPANKDELMLRRFNKAELKKMAKEQVMETAGDKAKEATGGDD